MVTLSNFLVAVATGFYLVAAHPGHDETAEMRKRSEFLASLEPRALAKCAPKLQARGHEKKMMERRQAIVQEMREARGFSDKPLLSIRDIGPVLAKDHHSKLNLDFTAGVEADWTLSGQNKSVVLSPESTEGPYYVSGESVRRDLKEGQKGVEITLDVQLIDMNKCEPLPNVAVDLWSCNATGVYGGVAGGGPIGNGNGNDANNIQNKALRGIQVSDTEGSVVFDTLVPGHYMGRTNHIHILTRHNAKIQPNNTITGGTVSHVGQIFFDQALIEAVEKTGVYATNKQPWTKNNADGIMAQESAGDSDPVVEYVLIGDKVEDGLFAWINVGVDPSKSKAVNAASTCTANGCTSSGMMGMLGAFAGALGGGLGGLDGLGGLGSLFGGLFGQPATPRTGPSAGV